MRFFFSRLFPLPFIIAGAMALYIGCRHLQQAHASTTWPTTQGVIQQSSVEYHRSSKGGGTYHAEIMYDFAVNAIPCSGHRIAFGDYDSSNPSHARTLANRYPKDKTVTVYHNPEDPTVCVLEPGVKGQAWFLPGFGLVFLAAGMLFAVFLPKAMRSTATPNQTL